MKGRERRLSLPSLPLLPSSSSLLPFLYLLIPSPPFFHLPLPYKLILSFLSPSSSLPPPPLFSLRILHTQDPGYFTKAHVKSGHAGSYTAARVLHYPPLPSDVVIKPGQLRCGEHVDYGSITLLFQDPTGGLQVHEHVRLCSIYLIPVS